MLRLTRKEAVMLVILVVLVILFICFKPKKNIIDCMQNNSKDKSQVKAALFKDEIKEPDYRNLEFISKEQFFEYQVGVRNENIKYYTKVPQYVREGNEINEIAEIGIELKNNRINIDDDLDDVYMVVHITLKNVGDCAGMFMIKPKLRYMLDNGIYDDALNDKFTLVDMSFDTDVEGYTLANVPADNGKINTDMGFVRTDDWSKHFFRVYIESNSEISYTCVFRTPKEYADDENLVIGNDDSHASRRWDGEKEVTYDNGGYRIYINRQ